MKDKEEIIKRSIAIAKFEGFDFVNDDPDAYPEGYWFKEDHHSLTVIEPKEFQYHEDWNWLMPVVKKVMEDDGYSSTYEVLKADLTWCDINRVFISVSDYCLALSTNIN